MMWNVKHFVLPLAPIIMVEKKAYKQDPIELFYHSGQKQFLLPSIFNLYLLLLIPNSHILFTTHSPIWRLFTPTHRQIIVFETKTEPIAKLKERTYL